MSQNVSSAAVVNGALRVNISSDVSKGSFHLLIMPPKELWEAYCNPTVRQSVPPAGFVSGAYLL